MDKFNVLNIGGDARQVHLINHLIDTGYRVSSFGLYSPLLSDKCTLIDNYKDALQTHNIVICPTPFSKDGKQLTTLKNDIIIYINELRSYLSTEHLIIGGNLPDILKDLLDKKKISYIDLMSNDAVAIENSVSTAEGAIAKAITSSPINMNCSNCLVIGYGRCGKVLAKKLAGLGANVYILTRSKENNATAISYGYKILKNDMFKNEMHKFEFIFNTVPSLILTAEFLEAVNSDVTIIDIASAPGGLDYDYVQQNKINAFLYSGIPGKISPKSSGIILANAITDLLNERSD